MKKKLSLIFFIIALILVISGGYFLYGKNQHKNLSFNIDKIFLGYSSYIIDMGKSPNKLQDLYANVSKSSNWQGPYVSESAIFDYKRGNIELIKASNIPTKSCGLDLHTNCFIWIMVENVSSSEFSKIKLELNPKTALFFANKKLYFKVAIAE